MAKPYRVLRAARCILLVFAYLLAGLNLIFGFIRLIGGGDPVPITEGYSVSMRVIGFLNIVGAPLTFLLFYVPSGVLHLLLDLREQVGKSS